MSQSFQPALRSPQVSSATKWLICIIASIGFAFDIYEILMAPLVVPFAIEQLGGFSRGSPQFYSWVGRLFYIPAIAGGLFGLVGGYLTDRLGRRRVLTWSILLYAFSAFFAGFSTNLWMLLIFRCTTFIGVCVEFVAAVAWLAELFPDHKQKERVLGYTQAFSSVGGLLVALANWTATKYGGTFPAVPLLFPLPSDAIFDAHAAWRYTLMSGLIPAIPLIIIRPFLPESPVWAEKRAAGTLRRPSLAAIFSPQLITTTLITTVMFACSYGAAFGAIQQMPQMIESVPEVQKEIKDKLAKLPPSAAQKPPAGEITPLPAASTPTTTAPAGATTKPASTQGKKGPPPAAVAAARIRNERAAEVTSFQEIGGLAGRVILAVLAVRILSRRILIRIFQIPGLLIFPVVFLLCTKTDLMSLKVGMFLAGLVTVAQFSFWGNYLPRVYPVHLRGTGESFAANIGGRMIGTSFAWVTASIAGAFAIQGNAVHNAHMWAYTAAGVGFAVYLAGFIASFWLPEPTLKEEE